MGYGGSPEYVDSLNNTVIAMMIEKKGAVENLEEILEIPGVDRVQCGDSDYSMSIGKAGEKSHPDVVAAHDKVFKTALKMGVEPRAEVYSIDDVKKLLIDLIKSLELFSDKNGKIQFPGYTHMQRAQPILLSHHLLAYAEMFLRDIDRFFDSLKRVDVMPLGSGALAGLPYELDREYVAEELGFSNISANSMDDVSDRDFVIDYLSAASI
mgnify:CR=1 FL=1